MRTKSNWPTLISLCVSLAACRSNPLGDTQKPNEDFHIYVSDFTARSDGGMTVALVEVINASSATLDCAFSRLTLPAITDLLIAKAQAGVRVRIAFDADAETSDPGSTTLRNSGAFQIVMTPGQSGQAQLLYGNRGAGAMRHNFCLADDRMVYIATAAPDDTQMRSMPQVALKVSGAAFGLPQEFRREINLFSQLVFGAGKTKTDFSTRFSALGQGIQVYWGPQEDPMDVLGQALADTTHWVDLYSTTYQSTNTGKPLLDVPQVLTRLESAKGLPVAKVFSAAALSDKDTQAFTLAQPMLYANPDATPGANIFLVDRGRPSARAFIYTGAIRAQANSADDSLLICLGGKYATEIIARYLDTIANAASDVSSIGDASSPGAVVINEIHWMGSYSNSWEVDGSDEFIELYNTTDAAVNLSGWRFACSTNNGATTSSDFYFPAATIIGPKSFFVVAAKTSGAFPRADFSTGDLGMTNNSTECRLVNAQKTLIDSAGDSLNAFDATATLGTNDTTNKIRRSMERVNPMIAGNSLANWKSNSYTPAINQFVAAAFSAQTFASPGAPNSTVTAITMLNPSFEILSAWTSLTAGTLVYDAAVTPQNGKRIIRYQSLTSSIGGREFQSECIAVSPLTNYTASIYEYAPATNASFVSASLKLWWYSDAACGVSVSQGTQPQSTVSPQNSWNFRSYSQTSPAGTQSMRLSVRARYATAVECGVCTNTDDMIYFDSAGITTP